MISARSKRRILSLIFILKYKQTMVNEFPNEHNKVKNSNWQEADQLAIYKRSREVGLRATENNIS